MSNWLPVAGYEGLYEVSDEGQVRSVTRMVPWRDTYRTYETRTLAVVLNKGKRCTKGHLRVYLSRDGQIRSFYLHNLVLEAFISPRPRGMKGLHRDDDPYNNCVGNLYWGTDQENAVDIVRNGNNMNVNKTHCKRGHLLELPNLSAAHLAIGKRQCLACQRARGIRNHVDLQRLSDQKFVEIMAGVP